MPRDITITFEDGSTHVYKGAPDTITPDVVQKRAEAQFKKSVTGIDGGKKQEAPQEDGFLTKIRKGAESILEPAVTIATGMAAAPVAGFAGMAGDAYSGLTGTARIGDAVAADVASGLTYQPRSEGGKENLAAFGKAFESSKLAGLPMADLSAVNPMAQAARAAKQQAPLMSSAVRSSLAPDVSRQFAKPAAEAAEQAALEKGVIDSGNMGAKLDNLATAREHGIAVNPNTTNPIAKNKVGAALVGDSDLNRGAYRLNQPKANSMARSDLGIPEGAPLTSEAYTGVKQGFIDVSEEIKRVPKFQTDAQYLNSLNERSFITALPEEEQALLRNSKQVNKLIDQAALPEITGTGAIAIMRELRAKSSKVLNNPTADPAATALANAQRNVAKQIEAMIERRLTGMGKADLAKRFADERTLYAKAKAYESVTTKNGDIQVPKLKSGKGHTAYTGNLKVLTDLGEAFPEVFTPPPTGGSGLNLTLGGRLNTALDIVSTPIRNKMLSEGYQAKNASPLDMRPPAPVPQQPVPLPALDGPPVVPGSWREGMMTREQSLPLPALSEDLLPIAERYQGTNIPIGTIEAGGPIQSRTPFPSLPPQGRGMLSLADEQPSRSPQASTLESIDFPLKFEVANRPEIVRATHAFIDEAASIRTAIALETNGFKRAQLEAKLRGVESRFMAGWRELGFKNEAQLRDLTQKLYQGGEGTQRGIEHGFQGMMSPQQQLNKVAVP